MNARRGRRGRRDDTGSLPFALLLGLIGISLTALMLPVVLSQISIARTDMTRVRALHAAQAGLDVAVAQIRAAGSGGPGRLPCGPLSNTHGGGGPGAYRTDIYYLTVDPSGRDLSWVAPRAMSCPVTSQPTYAWLDSTGRDGVRGARRTLEATYTFPTIDAGGFDGRPLHDIGEK